MNYLATPNTLFMTSPPTQVPSPSPRTMTCTHRTEARPKTRIHFQEKVAIINDLARKTIRSRGN